MRGVEIRALECCALGLLAEELQQSGVGLYAKIELPQNASWSPSLRSGAVAVHSWAGCQTGLGSCRSSALLSTQHCLLCVLYVKVELISFVCFSLKELWVGP